VGSEQAPALAPGNIYNRASTCDMANFAIQNMGNLNAKSAACALLS
jgi:hypothetical protein